MDKRSIKKFKLLANDIKNLSGEARLKHVKNYVLKFTDMNYRYGERTFLSAAVQHPDDVSNVEILKILVENGANIQEFGLFYKAVAYSCKNILTIEYLLENSSTNFAPLFSYAAMSNDFYADLLKLCIKYGFDINYSWPDGETLLIRALKNNCIGATKTLLEMGSDIGCLDVNGNGILHYVLESQQDNIDILLLILKAGTDVKAITMENICEINCKIMLLAERIRILIEYGFEVTNCNNSIEKLLMKFIVNYHASNMDLIKGLLRRDDININYLKNWDMHGSLLSAALQRNYTDLVKVLLNYGADYRIDTTYFSRSIKKMILEIELEKEYCEKNVIPNIRAANGEFTLNPSSIHSKTLAVKWLLARDNVDDVYGQLVKESSPLLVYYGIQDGDTLRWKIMDNLAHT